MLALPSGTEAVEAFMALVREGSTAAGDRRGRSRSPGQQVNQEDCVVNWGLPLHLATNFGSNDYEYPVSA